MKLYACSVCGSKYRDALKKDRCQRNCQISYVAKSPTVYSATAIVAQVLFRMPARYPEELAVKIERDVNGNTQLLTFEGNGLSGYPQRTIQTFSQLIELYSNMNYEEIYIEK